MADRTCFGGGRGNLGARTEQCGREYQRGQPSANNHGTVTAVTSAISASN